MVSPKDPNEILALKFYTAGKMIVTIILRSVLDPCLSQVALGLFFAQKACKDLHGHKHTRVHENMPCSRLFSHAHFRLNFCC